MPVESCCFAHKTNCLYVIVVVVVVVIGLLNLCEYHFLPFLLFFHSQYNPHPPPPPPPSPKKENNQTAPLMIANYTCTLSAFLTFVGKRFVLVEIFIKVT